MSAPANKGTHPEKSKAKLYTVIGVIVAIAVLVLILWNNNVFSKSTSKEDAVTIGDYTYSVAEVNYYYQLYFNNTYNMAQTYEQYGISIGYDTSLRPSEQWYNEEEGQTYADYFRASALNELQYVTILVDQAKEAGYTLSDEGAAAVDAQLAEVDATLLQYNVLYGGSEAYYFSLMYGEEMTKGLLKEMLTQSMLAVEYADVKAESFTYDDDALNDYYLDHADELDSFDYRNAFIPMGEIAYDLDEDGFEMDATDEQIAAAMALAYQQAEEMVARINEGEDFNTVAASYVSEDSRESYADPDYSLVTDYLGSSVTGDNGDWLKDPARRNGDLGIIESADSGYYVMQLINRERRDNSYQHANLYSMLVLAESTRVQQTDEEGNPIEGEYGEEYSDEQVAAALTQAEELLAQWEATSDKTFENFEALVPEEVNEDLTYYPVSAETLTEVGRNEYTSEFDAWAFAPGSANQGDAAIFAVYNGQGDTIGYRIMYITDFGPAQWHYIAENALRSEAYDDWYQALEPDYPVVELDGMQYVGDWGGTIGGTVTDEDDLLDEETPNEEGNEEDLNTEGLDGNEDDANTEGEEESEGDATNPDETEDAFAGGTGEEEPQNTDDEAAPTDAPSLMTAVKRPLPVTTPLMTTPPMRNPRAASPRPTFSTKLPVITTSPRRDPKGLCGALILRRQYGHTGTVFTD